MNIFLILCCLATITKAVVAECGDEVGLATLKPCPDDLTDDGTSCWRDTYERGDGRTPDIAPCGEHESDNGNSCWLVSYDRGVGRIPDKTPCPSGLRDDGTSCWSDAHVYGKGCCCTLWGCCNICKTGYTEEECTCRKTDVGIKVTLSERLTCRADEELIGSLCYQKCKEGYITVGCCTCEPEGGPHIGTTYEQRYTCNSNEELYGDLCYPKCKEGYSPIDCCVCEPDGGRYIEVTQGRRSSCPESTLWIDGICYDTSNCSDEELYALVVRLG